MRKTIFAVALGGALEMYDFVCYTLLASVIAPQFFPQKSHSLSLLLTYAVFVLGYLMRPVGGIVYGHFGDKVGRKDTLIFSVMMMALPSFILGLLPTYASIGIAAPLLLIFLRLLQGFAVGGDFPGAIVFISEHSKQQHLNRNNAWIFAGVNGGVMLATGLCALLAWLFSAAQWHSYVWRIPFLSSIFIALLGIYYRQKLSETAAFLQLKKSQQSLNFPLHKLSRHYWRNISKGVMMVSFPAMIVSIIFLFMPSYLHTYLHLTLRQSFLMSSSNLAALVVSLPLAGLLADKIGLHRALFYCAIFFICFAYPLYFLLLHLNVWAKLLPMLGLSLGGSVALATMGPALFCLFPVSVRYSGIGVTYNLALAIFGGTGPFLATLILHFLPGFASISLCLIIAAVLCLVGLFWPVPQGERLE